MSKRRTVLGELDVNNLRPAKRCKSEKDPTSAPHSSNAAIWISSSPDPVPTPSPEPDPTSLALLTTPAPTTIDVVVTQRLMGLFESLPSNHPIFGLPERNRIRLPLRVASHQRSNGKSWQNVCIAIGKSVRTQMGDIVPDGSCWMSRKTYVDIQAHMPGTRSTTVFRKIATVRLLAFLQDPSDANWTRINATSESPVGEKAIDSPFSHACGNGLVKDDSGRSGPQNQVGCINGLDHGRLATRRENESHKMCSNGSLYLCPGHGEPPVPCIFVHKTGAERGLIKPCLMKPDHTPACSCDLPCILPRWT